MRHSTLLPELVSFAAERNTSAPALTYGKRTLNYGELQTAVSQFASGLLSLGLQRGEWRFTWKSALKLSLPALALQPPVAYLYR